MWLRLIIGVIVIYLLYRLIRGPKGRQAALKNPPAPPGEDLIEDPQCHAYVPISRACQESINGKTWYFCSQSCLEQFKKKAGTAGDE